jgi:hypothetical protein
MTHTSSARLISALTIVAMVVAPASMIAQAAPAAPAAQAHHGPPAAMSPEEITAFAKVQIAISKTRDSIQAQFAQSRNKTAVAQGELQEKLRKEIGTILQANKMSEEEFRKKTYIVSTDNEVRAQFDSTVAQITGVPIPGRVAQAPAAYANLPAGPAGTHIGHVVNNFMDTPNNGALLTVAMAEARVALQHAQLALRNPSNLDALKLHAGHVIHAIDPTIVNQGPGAGYGMKKAAMGVVAHIEMAAKAEGAPPNVVTHSVHIATASRAAVARADKILEMAKQVREATDAAAAAALMNQIASLAEQLTAGADANGDGRIGWQDPEGGLQQAEEHVRLMLGSGR